VVLTQAAGSWLTHPGQRASVILLDERERKMTKTPGQKHYQREDQEHAAHQNEAARQDREVAKPIVKGHVQHDGHPVEGHPKSPQKGQ
jgi:hypothetical protein